MYNMAEEDVGGLSCKQAETTHGKVPQVVWDPGEPCWGTWTEGVRVSGTAGMGFRQKEQRGQRPEGT